MTLEIKLGNNTDNRHQLYHYLLRTVRTDMMQTSDCKAFDLSFPDRRSPAYLCEPLAVA